MTQSDVGGEISVQRSMCSVQQIKSPAEPTSALELSLRRKAELLFP
jgi:hypothetical protein